MSIFNLSPINEGFLDNCCNYLYNIFCFFCDLIFFCFESMFYVIDFFYQFFILNYSENLWIMCFEKLYINVSTFWTIQWHYSFVIYWFSSFYHIFFPLAFISSLYGEYFGILWVIYKIFEFFFEVIYYIGCWIIIFIFFGFNAFLC